MLSTERYLSNPETGIEYKLVLSLMFSGTEPDWNMVVYARRKSPENGGPEKKFEENENFFDWEIVAQNFPKDCEIMFGTMKDYIFDQLNFRFGRELRKYKTEMTA